jgi:CheY-like chemotaxis protein
VRAVVAEMLIGDGHEVIETVNGTEALARLVDGRPIDLVLTDLGMPGMTGWDLARAVKTSDASVVVGLVTGWGEFPDAEPDQRHSVDFILSKPVERETLYRVIAQARSSQRRA